MKILIALSLLVTSTAFANMDDGRKIKCYETPRQGERGKIAYVLAEGDFNPTNNVPPQLLVVYPFQQPLFLYDGCLSGQRLEGANEPKELTLCPGTGQDIGRLVPIEAEYGRDEETVYCERDILDYFENF